MLEMYKKVVLENYANFNGRARRREYWMFFLANLIISFVIGFLFGLLAPKVAFVANFYSLLVLIPSFAVAIRRLHDVNKSGWFILIPIYNIILLATEGDKGPNQYGEDPKNEFDEMNQIGKE
ncbi:DUF805 domain-containing protein [Flavobacterium hibernum]|uniref:Cytochrome n=1 Tax=Flavobacterium hibernum TaxID=37752 RepID=A0A0D0EIY3_9FLAO|nr:DUF805 domain-containing protein [Flavobacterium hibernum]KIO50585.1 cytochrome [Flavobacterium hibernum]OXA87450.1 DUF805 domain-containing protein [Flavobacterium hibernum]STO14318.1 Inner membrane protein yhaH [Flavobacterium hibernum]